jgi:hypothetical protein
MQLLVVDIRNNRLYYASHKVTATSRAAVETSTRRVKMKANKVRIPVTVTYTGYYEFEYEDTYSMDAIMDEELEPTPENKEVHWQHGVRKLRDTIQEEIEECGVHDVLAEDIKCAVAVSLGLDEERKLRAIFDAGYAELEEVPLED